MTWTDLKNATLEGVANDTKTINRFRSGKPIEPWDKERSAAICKMLEVSVKKDLEFVKFCEKKENGN